VKGDFLFPESIAGWRTKIQNCFCITAVPTLIFYNALT